MKRQVNGMDGLVPAMPNTIWLIASPPCVDSRRLEASARQALVPAPPVTDVYVTSTHASTTTSRTDLRRPLLLWSIRTLGQHFLRLPRR